MLNSLHPDPATAMSAFPTEPCIVGQLMTPCGMRGVSGATVRPAKATDWPIYVCITSGLPAQGVRLADWGVVEMKGLAPGSTLFLDDDGKVSATSGTLPVGKVLSERHVWMCPGYGFAKLEPAVALPVAQPVKRPPEMPKARRATLIRGNSVVVR